MIEQLKNNILTGDCAEILENLPDSCIDMVLTSPPYDDLRVYKGYKFDYKKIINELYRVVKPGGVVVWVVADAVVNGGETGNSFRQALYFQEVGFNIHDTMIYEKNGSSFPARRDGNRYSQIFEYMFVFSKGKPKTAKLICDKKNRWVGWINWGKKTLRTKEGDLQEQADMKPIPDYSPRNNIWKFNTGCGYSASDKFAKKHPAIFPEDLALDQIRTWSKEGDIVLDPMCGSGTTLKLAKSLKRHFIGIEISSEYTELALQRLETAKIIDEKSFLPKEEVQGINIIANGENLYYEMPIADIQAILEIIKPWNKIEPNLEKLRKKPK